MVIDRIFLIIFKKDARKYTQTTNSNKKYDQIVKYKIMIKGTHKMS